MRTEETTIRQAVEHDLAAVVSMMESRRVQYEEYEPVFWRKADDSADHARAFMAASLGRDDVHFLVARDGEKVVGFLVARRIAHPPVYRVDGPTYQIDDFCVLSPGLWGTAGKALLRHVRVLVKREGAAQVVVVCGDKDHSKAEMLRQERLSVASNWWTQPL